MFAARSFARIVIPRGGATRVLRSRTSRPSRLTEGPFLRHTSLVLPFNARRSYHGNGAGYAHGQNWYATYPQTPH
jgi:hypothetical protein